MYKEQIEKLTSHSATEFRDNAELFLELNSVYRNLFGSSLCCFPEVESALIRLKTYYTEKIEKMETQKGTFQLKPETLLYSNVTEKYYTEKTITDTDALILLKSAPQMIEQFEVFPSDWETQVANFDFQSLVISENQPQEPTADTSEGTEVKESTKKKK